MPNDEQSQRTSSDGAAPDLQHILDSRQQTAEFDIRSRSFPRSGNSQLSVVHYTGPRTEPERHGLPQMVTEAGNRKAPLHHSGSDAFFHRPHMPGDISLAVDDRSVRPHRPTSEGLANMVHKQRHHSAAYPDRGLAPEGESHRDMGRQVNPQNHPDTAPRAPAQASACRRLSHPVSKEQWALRRTPETGRQ